MSSRTKDYTVTTKGPINIGGGLHRAGDTVRLNDAQARSYALHIKRTRKPGSPAATETPTPQDPKRKKTKS